MSSSAVSLAGSSQLTFQDALSAEDLIVSALAQRIEKLVGKFKLSESDEIGLQLQSMTDAPYYEPLYSELVKRLLALEASEQAETVGKNGTPRRRENLFTVVLLTAPPECSNGEPPKLIASFETLSLSDAPQSPLSQGEKPGASSSIESNQDAFIAKPAPSSLQQETAIQPAPQGAVSNPNITDTASANRGATR
jgi:hypothetical protein